MEIEVVIAVADLLDPPCTLREHASALEAR
jgi:hypothetical protein